MFLNFCGSPEFPATTPTLQGQQDGKTMVFVWRNLSIMFYVALPCLYIKSLTFPLHYGKCKSKNIAHLRDYPHPVQGQGHGLHVTNDWCIMSSTVLNDLSSNKFPKFKIFSHKYFFRSKKSSKPNPNPANFIFC